MFQISTRTLHGPSRRDFPVQEPGLATLVSDFESMLTSIMAQPNPNGRSRGDFPSPMMGMFPFPMGEENGLQGFGPSRTIRTATGRIYAQPGGGPVQIQAGNVQE